MNELMQEILDSWVRSTLVAAERGRREFEVEQDRLMLEAWSRAWKEGPAPETGKGR